MAHNDITRELRELIGSEVPADELERLGRVDALLRTSARAGAPYETYELRLGFGELALVYKSLQAVRTLGALAAQDELLDDTILLVDQALQRAV